jgi:hypothetical protein
MSIEGAPARRSRFEPKVPRPRSGPGRQRWASMRKKILPKNPLPSRSGQQDPWALHVVA